MLDELIMIRRFRDLIEAELAKGKLASAGIDCLIADENTVRSWSSPKRPTSLVACWTNRPDQIIEEDSNLTYIQPRCPRCDSLDVSFETLEPQLSYTLMFLNLAFPISKNNWKCQNRGAEWVEESETQAEEGT